MELYPDSHHLSELDLYNVLMVALMVKNLPAMQEPQVRSLGWVGEDPLEKGMALQYSCPEYSKDKGAWKATYSPRGCKELDMTEWLTLFHF